MYQHWSDEYFNSLPCTTTIMPTISKKNAQSINTTKKVSKKIKPKTLQNNLLEPLDFELLNERALSFAQHIELHSKEISEILLDYESSEVVKDETNRTLDILKHLHENKSFFALRIGSVTSFLPRNQPLYALTCFVLVPSLMAQDVHFRIPHSMRHFFPRLLRVLKINEFFPNIIISRKERLQFLRERSALKIDPKTEESMPVTDAVIFTGTSLHAEKLRLVFDQRTLFIANGSGHNPIVIAEDANIPDAVEAALDLQLYNQGQDCAAPNAILVHKHSFKPFIRHLREELQKVHVGNYRDQSCRVGPISEPEDLKRIQNLLVDNLPWLDESTPGIIRTNEVIVEPTIICKPLKEGGNFTEVFSPIIFVQQYDDDNELSTYFEHSHYARNAMYISLYGTSKYVESLIGKTIEGKILHDKASILHDKHLHMPGMERGVKPYGGFGYAASSISINGKIIPKPTLPQRDIYEQLVKPIIASKSAEKRREALSRMKKLQIKDVRKLLGLKTVESTEVTKNNFSGKSYVDALDIIASDAQRYIEFVPERTFHLLNEVNIEHVAVMEPRHIHQIRALRKYINQHKSFDKSDFMHFLYGVAKKLDATDKENKEAQLAFFKNIYQLLLGKDSGPRLTHFLIDADRRILLALLDV